MAEPLFEAPRRGGPDALDLVAREVRLPFDTDDPRLAAASWSRVAEPGDEVAGALVAHLGAPGALGWLVEALGDPARTLCGGALAELGSQVARDRLCAAVARWAPRLDRLDPRRELRVLDRLDGTLLVPGDPRWPGGLRDLGPAAPFALWVRGRPDLAATVGRSVAVVGARAASAYGEHVTADLAAGLAERGFTVLSGGAYGIDAAAHRGALAVGGTTVAVLAGGVDRFYPQGNHELLRRIAGGGGSVVSEVPPGSAPFRQRFLARNRLIAAAAQGTVVVEAAWRSGALSTARKAAELLRPLGAVPGPVTSATSTGCHGLLRAGAATCVTDVGEVVELVGRPGELAPVPASGAPGERAMPEQVAVLGDTARRVWDALPLRGAVGLEAVARTAGLSVRSALAGLGTLEQHALVMPDGDRWRRAAAPRRAPGGGPVATPPKPR
ncbi:DNA-processing protein DprA [Isoptericola sp. NEAU-Y5]|uniref:DNA-processing protein DprA n=1 Tax=Isoptericola luteus TaxID=2879484 RepID=A0ABS7ZDY5_9MICO|nr:DNA-processing protein DprA [Isoptericola sp. NEAU-Y5]MCA5893245.1 DNA-processing protein DprA [Isoptericola sp. NEAU-Y5]